MSDEISNVTGIDEVMVVGEPAWHRKGRVRGVAATAAETLTEAHLDWTVSKQPVYARQPDGDYHKIPGQYTVVRDDVWGSNNPVAFGTVGEKYRPLQNVEAFSFFDNVVGEGAAVYETAGALFSGKRIWIMAKLPETVKVVGDDVVNQYLLLTNTHDGTSSVQVYFTPVRVVCWNTLSMSLSSMKREVRVRHTESMMENLRTASRIMGIVKIESKQSAELFQAMPKFEMTGRSLKDYFEQIYPTPQPREDEEEVTERTRTNHSTRIGTLSRIFEESPSIARIPGARGTLWGAYNSVTQYVDHVTKDKSDEKQMQRTIFGSGRDVKISALEVARRIVQAA